MRARRHLALLALLALGVSPTLTPQNPPPELAEGGRALADGDLETAEARFRALLERQPDSVGARLGLSRVLEVRGELGLALEQARLAERAAPDNPVSAFAVGRLLARLEATEPALAALDRARELAPNDPEPTVLTALVLRDAGRPAEGAERLQQLWDAGQRSRQVAELLASLYLTLDRPGDALEIAEAALAIHGDDAGLLLARGLALGKNSDLQAEAITTLERAIALDPPRPGRAWLELAALKLDDGDPEGALSALREAERLLPASPEVAYRLGVALRATGDVEGAKEALARFQTLRQQLDAEGATAKRLGTELNAALALADEDRLEDALAKLDEILTASPDNARVHAARGKVLFSLQRAEEALAAVVRARELDPGRSEHHFLEGLFLLSLGRTVQAEAAERRALDLDPGLGQAHVMLAGALAKQDRPQEAAEHFARALELGVDTPTLRLGYAGVLETLGRRAESAAQIEAYERLKNRPPPAIP